MMKLQRTQRWTRSPDGYLGGVCEGLAQRFDVAPIWIRVGWLTSVALAGFGIGLYLALWLILPREDRVLVEPTIWTHDSYGRARPPLVRTQVDRILFGVCGGLAQRWQIDPSLVRLGALSLATLSLGLVVIGYLMAAMILPTSEQLLDGPKHPVDI